MKTVSKNNNTKIEQLRAIDDKKISIALMASFVVLTIQYFILTYFDLLRSSDASKIQLISKILVGIIFVSIFPVVWKRSKIKFLMSYFIGFFLFLLHYWIFPRNSIHIRSLIFPFFFMCLPAFVYSLSIIDWTILKQIMKKASFIVFLFGALLGSLVFAGKASVGTYSMSLSYYMLLPTIMYLDELFDRLSLKALFPVIISFLIILALGARGPILCIVIFIILKLLRPNFKQNNTSLLIYSLFLGAVSLLFLYLDSALKYLNSIFLSFGISSRSIHLFLRENISLSGRDRLYQSVIKEILDNPFLGIGLAGDRRIIGGYVHNLFLELLAHFGIVFGTIISMLLIFIIFKFLFIKDKDKYNMFIIWLSLGFVSLMVSGSYLTSLNFWILLGLVAGQLFFGNKRRDYNLKS